MSLRSLAMFVVLVGCSGRHHPDNFAAAPIHGTALKEQSEDCRECHGEDLTGGDSKIGCDGCHSGATPTAWRSNCTFCHGGVDNKTGAPPRNLDGTDLVGPFPGHTIHVTGSAIANAYDCTQCHVKAIDVLSPGHVFDATPGEAENDYGSGLSPQAKFNPADGTCSNAYCHGSGRGDDGNVARDAAVACSGCHPTQESGAAGWGNMSGPHMLHMSLAGVSCADCHSTTTTDGTTIASKALHINGLRDVAITEPGFAYDGAKATCNGSCHGYVHAGDVWAGGADGRYHPSGFSAPSAHGTELELQRQDCRGCHGANLEGGSGTGLSGPSCDGCHPGAAPTSWRTNCTFCHGGGLDQSGAPPRDLGSSVLNTAQSFVAHARHVSPAIMVANDCTTCHVKPVDVMSTNHAFDATPQVAEVNLTLDGRNPGATYAFATGTCSNLYCHGNGRTNGTYTDGQAPVTCLSCHGGKANEYQNLGGSHDHHKLEQCADCHLDVVATGSTQITNVLLHINKAKDVRLKNGTFNAATRTCTNLVCHGTETW
ncbi:MAG TPA: CxxxxCH/CxxCH domain-containing protein [Kofleriaceae bacterium]|nr:CxxxxCH/CxxCH domain-containing protein [Kofleriaceae bacterium]